MLVFGTNVRDAFLMFLARSPLSVAKHSPSHLTISVFPLSLLMHIKLIMHSNILGICKILTKIV